MSAPVRTRARVQGTVQGVGFRPFVYRLAHEQGLAGYVLNDERGVLLEVEGASAAVERFLARMRVEAPPLAAIETVACEARAPEGHRGFEIVSSERDGPADALVASDSATCPDCLAELQDPADRRFRYPFINCTNCGPRFTIVRDVPYDRPLTTMAEFVMCPECRREYEDPLDRRFHAEPNACPRCGPEVRLHDPGGGFAATAEGVDELAWTARRLAGGEIVAVKGIGGFHLVCDAANEATVGSLRARKHREDRPFALMVPTIEAAGELVVLDPESARQLQSAARPIVLSARRGGTAVAHAVAARAPELGLMLPYSPLHHLLASDFAAACADGRQALVMTSGNVSDEPIAYRDNDALERLAQIADRFLLHDRRIETRTDDSVIRTVRRSGERRVLMLRRSRGYVPAPLSLPIPAAAPTLACGAEQKSTFCLAREARAWVGHHIGDLEHFATLQAFREGVAHFERLFAVTPALVAHDLHPDYLSTRYALERPGVELVAVQHHHAHMAACLAEHGVLGPAVAAIFDGTGLGPDGTVWGGELLAGDLARYERGGWLWPVRMPGGAAAIRQPWRMAAAWLTAAYGEPQPPPRGLRQSVPEARWRAMASIGASADLSPVTSSMGRLFDAVGALCGLASEVSYEGQTAIELEALAAVAADFGPARAYALEVVDGPDGVVLDPRATMRALAEELEAGVPAARVAASFHGAVSAATAEALSRLASRHGVDTVVLSGGVFQNRTLLQAVAASLELTGRRVLVPERLPPNDGGISFGQAAVAAAQGSRPA